MGTSVPRWHRPGYGRGPRRRRLDSNLPAVHRGRRHLTRVEQLGSERGTTFDAPEGAEVVVAKSRHARHYFADPTPRVQPAVERAHPRGLCPARERSRRRCEGGGRAAGDKPRSWLKVKIRRAGHFAVVGIDVPITGSCSLLLARRVGRRLFYVGRVEWGAARGVVAQIREHCTARPMPACTVGERTRGVVWIEPDIIAEVTYSELRLG